MFARSKTKYVTNGDYISFVDSLEVKVRGQNQNMKTTEHEIEVWIVISQLTFPSPKLTGYYPNLN